MTVVTTTTGCSPTGLKPACSETGVFFVTRMKDNALYEVVQTQDTPRYHPPRELTASGERRRLILHRQAAGSGNSGPRLHRKNTPSGGAALE